ncbi:MAG: group III truncated hemoglobin [Saprospiraceae bacterium]
MKKDITTSEDVTFLVEEFYKILQVDEQIGYIFTEVVQLDLSEHLPIISSFWETVLLGKMTYRGNVMRKHITLNAKEKITEAIFDKWIQVWKATIDTHFEGEKANEAKERVDMMKPIMLYKMQVSEGNRFIQ